MKQLRLLLVAALGVAAQAVAAQVKTESPLVVTASNVTAMARGRTEGVAQPGDEIRYRLTLTNVTGAPVKNVKFVDPIPKGLVYVLGSATADQPVRVEYSIDGGKSFSAEPTITVDQNGKQVEQPAPRERYTNIRWTVVGPLAAKAQVTAEFRAQVREASGEAK